MGMYCKYPNKGVRKVKVFLTFCFWKELLLAAVRAYQKCAPNSEEKKGRK